MKSLTNYINEKLIVNKNYKPYTYAPKSFDELRKIIEQRYEEKGPGTEQDPVDFNDIDVSDIDSFYNKNAGEFGRGIFQKTKFKYIDISDWDVSNVTSMRNMFFMCTELKSVGDISYWDVSNVTSMRNMFSWCKKLKSVENISKWDVSNVAIMSNMFYDCEELEFIGDTSKWNVSSVTDMTHMFNTCKKFNQDISGWNVSKVRYHSYMFHNCPIKKEYKPKFK